MNYILNREDNSLRDAEELAAGTGDDCLSVGGGWDGSPWAGQVGRAYQAACVRRPGNADLRGAQQGDAGSAGWYEGREGCDATGSAE